MGCSAQAFTPTPSPSLVAGRKAGRGTSSMANLLKNFFTKSTQTDTPHQTEAAECAMCDCIILITLGAMVIGTMAVMW